LSFDLYSVLGYVDDLSIQSLLQEPCIIVATNGMMVENTPSARIARWMVQDERHGIFFCGYVDPDTLGYRVFHAGLGDEISFSAEGEPVAIRNPHIRRFYLSSHADRYELLEWPAGSDLEWWSCSTGKGRNRVYEGRAGRGVSGFNRGEGKTISLD